MLGSVGQYGSRRYGNGRSICKAICYTSRLSGDLSQRSGDLAMDQGRRGNVSGTYGSHYRGYSYYRAYGYVCSTLFVARAVSRTNQCRVNASGRRINGVAGANDRNSLDRGVCGSLRGLSRGAYRESRNGDSCRGQCLKGVGLVGEQYGGEGQGLGVRRCSYRDAGRNCLHSNSYSTSFRNVSSLWCLFARGSLSFFEGVREGFLRRVFAQGGFLRVGDPKDFFPKR